MENEENKEGILTRMYNKIDDQTKGQIAGISTEVGAGLALDAKTQWMLGAGPWGWLGYGVTNFIGAAGANIGAQKLRGEENIKRGEVLSSGLLGIIPGTSLRFGKRVTNIVGEANTVKRAGTFGATQGLTDQVIQKGIDEKRLPTPSEAALGLGVGGAIGGTLKHIQLNDNESGHLRIMLGKVDPDDADPSYINPLRQPETPIWVRSALASAGIREDGTFIFDKYLENRKYLKPADRRGLAGIFMTDPQKGFTGPKMDQALKNYTNLEKAKFMKIYTPEFLKKYKIDPSQLQLHHINALLGSLPLYDGVKYLSPEWMEITGTLLQKNVHAGNALKNLRFLVGRSKDLRTPHGVTHKYLDEVVGPDGTLFFTKELRDNMKLKGSYQAADGKTYRSYRSYIASQWADVVNKGNDITDQAVGIFNAVNADLLHLKPENIDEIMKSIGRLEKDGLVKPQFIEGRFQLDPKDIKKVIFDMEFDIEIGQYMLNTPQPALNALKEAISSDDPISSYKAIKAQLPKQLQLFSNTKIKKLKKKYKNNITTEYPSGPIGAYWDIDPE